MRHDDALFGTVKPQRAVDPASAHRGLPDGKLVVVNIDRGRGIPLHHPPQAPVGKVRSRAGVGIAVGLRKFDPDEVVRALPVETIAVFGADDVVGRT